MGSCVVALNVLPDQAVLCDTNIHIVSFYQSIQTKTVTAQRVREYLKHEGSLLLERGESHYYAIRERFNDFGCPLDFLFLNRSCFNGIIRFNRKGRFNTPFCRKPDRFRPAYITKIVNQVEKIESILSRRDWKFIAQDWRKTIELVQDDDFLYLDPPYIGRNTDYFNPWATKDADDLAEYLVSTKADFAYSMWYQNRFRKNLHIEQWFSEFPIKLESHFYHVGSTENLRNPVIEALILNRNTNR